MIVFAMLGGSAPLGSLVRLILGFLLTDGEPLARQLGNFFYEFHCLLPQSRDLPRRRRHRRGGLTHRYALTIRRNTRCEPFRVECSLPQKRGKSGFWELVWVECSLPQKREGSGHHQAHANALD